MNRKDEADQIILSPPPDYGEPWRAYGEKIKNTEGRMITAWAMSEELQSRIVDCVNACAGMRDPVAEIMALKEVKR